MCKKNKYIYRGFNLKSITWGYRDRFKKAIDTLYEAELLGKENETSTKVFFNLLKSGSDKPHSCFDHVLNNFICSLNTENNWILKIPALFSDWTSFGSELAKHKLYMGLRYFEIWGRSGFGKTPEDVSYVLDKARWLSNIDFNLAYYFIQSYNDIHNCLTNKEIDVFVDHSLVLYNRNPENAFIFLQLKTKTAKLYTQIISKEARLVDCRKRMLNLAKGISDFDMEINDFGDLDSDDLLDRGSSVVSMNKWLYLPAKISTFENRKDNIDYFMLLVIIASAGLQLKSFNLVHGQKKAASSLVFIKSMRIEESLIVNNCFIIFEIYRVLHFLKRLFPGISNIFKKVLNEEIRNNSINSKADELMVLILKHLTGKRIKPNKEQQRILSLIKEIVKNTESFEDVIKIIVEQLKTPEKFILLKKYFSREIKPLSFYPDYMFPNMISEAPSSELGADLKNQEESKNEDGDHKNKNLQTTEDNENNTLDEIADQKEKTDKKTPVGFFYDEWSQQVNDYYENWCCLKEKSVPVAVQPELKKEYKNLSQQVKKIFEKLKPDQTRKEKHLQEGDFINIDRLTEHLSLQKAKVFDKIKFYEKPYIKKRDLSVAVLIDMSGSTGEEVEKGKKIIDLEKNSAYILGEGLAELGDSFGIFGFSGSGRENAEFFVIKDFADDWDDKVKGSLFSARPKSSTRIGVALRHTGYKLSECHTRKKIIILITDGKPMDTHYEHTTRYAQYDVRKANEENYRAGIDSFCISTEENKIEDLEIMFPFHRYVIIKKMIELPKILSNFYLNITN